MVSLLRQPRTYLVLLGVAAIVAVVAVRLTGGTSLTSSSAPAGEAAPPTTAPGLQLPAANSAPTTTAPTETTAAADGAAEDEPAETATTTAPETTAPEPAGTVIFADDFDQLDSGKWLVADHAADVNQELQYYSPANVAAAAGTLRLSAEERETGGRTYASGMVTTAGTFSFTYGTVEWRARPVKGQGLWQALWLHGNDCAPTFQSGSQLCPSWPAPGSEEIDVLEYRGGLPQQIHMAFHHNTEPGQTAGMDCQWNGPDYSADWHTYTVEWSPGQLVWKIDGVERCRAVNNVPATPMYLVMNMAVGGFWAGAPNENTAFPQSFQVDWVRVTQP
jgi:beta-glucanase (GH16 family)